MNDKISFYLNNRRVEAYNNETIWDVSKREGIEIPHICHSNKNGYKPDGNCRACVVEVQGEKTLTASCIRKPTQGMKVLTNTSKVENSQNLVLELLLADQPRIKHKNFQGNQFWDVLNKKKINQSRFLQKNKDYVPTIDQSHPAMTVSLDACIQCGLCIRACRDVQVNDVLGMSGRGTNSYPVLSPLRPLTTGA